MPGLTFATVNELRDGALVGGSLERFLGRLTLAAIGVLVVVVAVEMLIPGDEVDAVWLGTAAALILLARQVGFWPSVLVAFGAAAVIVVLVIPTDRRPSGWDDRGPGRPRPLPPCRRVGCVGRDAARPGRDWQPDRDRVVDEPC